MAGLRCLGDDDIMSLEVKEVEIQTRIACACCMPVPDNNMCICSGGRFTIQGENQGDHGQLWYGEQPVYL